MTNMHLLGIPPSIQHLVDTAEKHSLEEWRDITADWPEIRHYMVQGFLGVSLFERQQAALRHMREIKRLTVKSFWYGSPTEQEYLHALQLCSDETLERIDMVLTERFDFNSPKLPERVLLLAREVESKGPDEWDVIVRNWTGLYRWMVDCCMQAVQPDRIERVRHNQELLREMYVRQFWEYEDFVWFFVITCTSWHVLNQMQAALRRRGIEPNEEDRPAPIAI
jgi:hypothetical protein